MSKNWPVLALAIALIAILGVSCYTNPSYQDKQKCADHSAPIAGIAPNEATHSGQNAQTAKYPPGWRKFFVWPEGVAALAVLLTLFFIGLQAFLTRQAIINAEDSSQRELRAYLSVNSGCLKFPSPNLPDAQVWIKNYGQTPAYKVRGWISIFPASHPLLETLQTPPSDFVMARRILGKDAEAAYVARKLLTEAELKILGTPDLTLYVYGKVFYVDIFGKEWTTEYRLIYGGPEGIRPMVNIDGKATSSWFLMPDAEGNEAT